MGVEIKGFQIWGTPYAHTIRPSLSSSEKSFYQTALASWTLMVCRTQDEREMRYYSIERRE